MKGLISSKPPRARLFIKARVMDPSQNVDTHADVLVERGKIVQIGKDLPRNHSHKDFKIIDCKSHILTTGLVDMRAFTGEPGSEHRETIKSASKAAAAGGITSFVMMPDTNPVIDDVALVDFVRQRANEKSKVHILPAAALSKGMAGEEMSEFGASHVQHLLKAWIIH